MGCMISSRQPGTPAPKAFLIQPDPVSTNVMEGASDLSSDRKGPAPRHNFEVQVARHTQEQTTTCLSQDGQAWTLLSPSSGCKKGSWGRDLCPGSKDACNPGQNFLALAVIRPLLVLLFSALVAIGCSPISTLWAWSGRESHLAVAVALNSTKGIEMFTPAPVNTAWHCLADVRLAIILEARPRGADPRSGQAAGGRGGGDCYGLKVDSVGPLPQ